MKKKLKYNLCPDGYVIAFGYRDYPFEVTDETPFQNEEEAFNWKKDGDNWVKYDPTWIYEQFPVRVTIPDNLILKNDMLLMLKSHVLQLVSEENAGLEEIDNCQVMYFIRLLPDHEQLLKTFPEIIIEKNETSN